MESSRNANSSHLPVLRALAECQTQIERAGARHIESMGLTPSQFDVLAVLGDMPEMTCKELCRQTLISRGTLTPVLDRLEAKGLVKRTPGDKDCRQTLVSLTPEGQEAYQRTFMPYVDFMRPYFDRLDDDEQKKLIALLRKLKGAFPA